jgi:hypothetical protein
MGGEEGDYDFCSAFIAPTAAPYGTAALRRAQTPRFQSVA